MLAKLAEREKAIQLRKDGLSYREILEIIPVAKSSLSLWLKSVGLSKEQKQRLTEKKLASIKRGWEACRNKRNKITKEIKENAIREIGEITKRELLLIGIALHWAEGSKEKTKSCGIHFSNSDAKMIQLFIKWLIEICGTRKDEMYFEIYLHETSKYRETEVKKFWQNNTGFPEDYFKKIRWKRNKINTKRKNIGEKYFGVLRVSVCKSTNLNRKITGWIEGILQNCGVV